jgi:hypothetical protein
MSVVGLVIAMAGAWAALAGLVYGLIRPLLEVSQRAERLRLIAHR